MEGKVAVGSYAWARKELQRTQQELHDTRENLRVAMEARNKAEARVEKLEDENVGLRSQRAAMIATHQGA